MKSPKHNNGFTKIDMLIVVLALCIIPVALLPYVAGRNIRVNPGRPRMQCKANLQNVALAMSLWANDHHDQLPWQVSTNEGGTMEVSGLAFRCFLAVSNELNMPRTLHCPLDKRRKRGQLWADFSDSKLSYFAALETNQPSAWLAGDRTLGTNVNSRTFSGIHDIRDRSTLRPLRRFHENYCNVALRDGSVLRVMTGDTSTEPIRLIFP